MIKKNTFFDLRGAALLGNVTHPVDDGFRGLLIFHEDRFELTLSGASAFEVVLFEQTRRTVNRHRLKKQ